MPWANWRSSTGTPSWNATTRLCGRIWRWPRTGSARTPISPRGHRPGPGCWHFSSTTWLCHRPNWPTTWPANIRSCSPPAAPSGMKAICGLESGSGQISSAKGCSGRRPVSGTCGPRVADRADGRLTERLDRALRRSENFPVGQSTYAPARSGELHPALMPVAGATTGPIIDVTNLTKRYGRQTAINQLTFAVPRACVGLLGANGAGKTTLVKALLGLTNPTSGSAKVLGLDTAKHGIEIRTRVGYMPESDCLPPGATAADFVAHMGEMSGLPE